MRYTFTQQKKYDILQDKVFIYYDEKESTETVTHIDPETEEETTDTYPIWTYRRAQVEKLEKGQIVNAIIREEYSQDAVEAIFRHRLDGETEEFDIFDAYAEWAKGEAVKILSNE